MSDHRVEQLETALREYANPDNWDGYEWNPLHIPADDEHDCYSIERPNLPRSSRADACPWEIAEKALKS